MFDMPCGTVHTHSITTAMKLKLEGLPMKTLATAKSTLGGDGNKHRAARKASIVISEGGRDLLSLWSAALVIVRYNFGRFG